jgi:GNAT superfamily N-acetyltransferase
VSEYLSVLLGPDHEVGAFRCGKPSLDDWLGSQARRAQDADTARTYVWTTPDNPAVVAYYSIAPTQLTKADVPRSLTGGYSTIPGYLLARLALDGALHGQGLRAELLVDALARIVEAARTGGGRLIVVDALDDQAKAFYGRHDFIPVEGAMRLYLKIATARAALDL